VSWPTVPASEFMLKRGGSVNPAKFPEEVFDLLSIPAFDKNEEEVLVGEEIGSSKSCVQPGDVLLSKIIPHIRRCWVVPPNRGRRQIGSGEWIIFRGKGFFPNYLKHFLTSNIFHQQFMNTVAGVGGSLVRARPAQVERIEIPLPPLAEQKRIAAILDKADAIRRKRQQAIQLADDFLRSVFLDMFGDPVSNPKGWEKCTVQNCIENGQILSVQDGNHGNDHPKVADFSDKGYPFIAANVVRRGKILFDKCYYLDESWLKKLRIGFAKPGDVLLTHKGSLGFTAVLDNTYSTYIFSPQTTYYRLDKELLEPEFLKGYFDTTTFQRVFKKLGIQSTRAYLGITKQKELDLYLPPINKQREYVRIAEKFLKIFESKYCSEFNFLSLFDSLSQKAFKGEL